MIPLSQIHDEEGFPKVLHLERVGSTTRHEAELNFEIAITGGERTIKPDLGLLNKRRLLTKPDLRTLGNSPHYAGARIDTTTPSRSAGGFRL